MGPMTIIIMIAIVAGVWFGGAAIVRAMREQARDGRGGPCPKCGTANAPHARFCSQCGESLHV